MADFKKVILIFLFVVVSIVAFTYFSFLFLLPGVINNKSTISKVQKIIKEKLNADVKFDGFELKTFPNLSMVLFLKHLDAEREGKIFAEADNIFICFAPLKITPKLVDADYISFDNTKWVHSEKKTKSGRHFDFSRIPNVNIKRGDIILSDTSINIRSLAVINNNNRKIITLDAGVVSGNLKENISIGEDGYLYIENNWLYAKKFSALLGSARLYADGCLWSADNRYDFSVKGSDLPVNVLESNFLFFIKTRNKQKNFIENFYNFSGLADVDLRIANSGIFGNAHIKNLGAVTVKYDIPILLPDVNFKFSGDKITSAANGKFGNENVYTDVNIINLFSQTERYVKGSVKSTLTGIFTEKYTPECFIKGHIPILVEYYIKNRVVTVNYFANVPKDSNIYYRNADLGLMNSDRRVFAKTVKKGDKLFLENYDYSFVKNNEIDNILTGEGLFVKKNRHLTLDYITCKTNGYAPVSVTGSFGRYVDGGVFSGDLKYFHSQKLLTGNFIVKDSRYKDFYVEKAVVNADSNNLKLAAKGTFEKSPFICYADLLNSFKDKIVVHDIHLYLKKYLIKRGKHHTVNKPKLDNDIEWIIENGSLMVDEIRYKKIAVSSIEISGSLKDGVVKFLIPESEYAQGVLSGDGTYDIDKQVADINFSAMNINSNIAADMLFNLKDQVQGLANASMHLKTFDGLEKFNAHTEFFIEDGALTKIGSTEFMIKKNKKIKRNIKFKLTDIINIDINKMKALRSNLYGEFDVNNHIIENAQIFSKHKYLSLFTEGYYNIHSEQANITVWGKYNKSAQKNIKILFVPLSFITKIVFRPEYTKTMYKEKLDMIPPIDAKPGEEENFTVRMNGNLNDNSSIRVELKSIR